MSQRELYKSIQRLKQRKYSRLWMLKEQPKSLLKFEIREVAKKL